MIICTTTLNCHKQFEQAENIYGWSCNFFKYTVDAGDSKVLLIKKFAREYKSSNRKPHNSKGAAIEAYLQSIYYQHDK
jgi:hypothetical protein